MCEYCDEIVRNGQDLMVYKDGQKWRMLIMDFERKISIVKNVSYCPQCGRNLKEKNNAEV